jgi:hypothetical protein
MKKGWIFILMILLCLGVASASSISIYEIDSTTIVEPGEIGEYNLEVTNLGSQVLNLQIKGDPFVGLPSSYIEYVMVDPDGVTLGAHETVDVNVKIKVKEDAITQKRYQTYITIDALNIDDLEEEYSLEVFAKEPEKEISMYIKDYPESIQPGKDYTVTVALENNLQESLSNVNVYVSSVLFEEYDTVQLFAGQERDIEFSFPIESTSEPGDYELSARVFYGEELQGSEEVDFIVDLNLDVSESVEDISKFLHRDITVTKTNNGNYVVGESYNIDLGTIESWFAKYSIRPTYKDNTGSYWNFNLDPAEEYSIQIRVDYRPLVIAIIVIIVFILLMWYWMSKGVVIKKEVFKLKQTSEGISDFKILIHIKNNTNKTVKNLMMIEMLPRVINPLPKFGTLKPNNVQRGEKGVRMIWRIPELVKGEERIISYDVEAKMKIIGQFMLPQSMVKYRTHRGKVMASKSNRLSVASGFLSESIRKKKK